MSLTVTDVTDVTDVADVADVTDVAVVPLAPTAPAAPVPAAPGTGARAGDRDTDGSASRASRWGSGERRSVLGMAVTVLALNLVGWGVLLLAVAPQRLAVGSSGVFGVGLGATAFLLGVRHAFDPDHIAAVDNATRRLVAVGARASSTGFWFSLGHSSVVLGASVLLALGAHTLIAPLTDPGSAVHQLLAQIGALVAGTFLLLVGVLNVRSVRGMLRLRRQARVGVLDEARLEHHLAHRGVAARVLDRVSRRASRPGHLYPVGLLMGLGFDTATQVALLVLAGGTAALALPWYAILVLPVLFAAGMTLFDGLDGVVMARVYRWAAGDPGRRLGYNLVVTGLSAAAALGIGGLVLLQANGVL